MLVLSLFPGIGLLDRAFEEEGFCVVRGPDLIWGGDIRRFHPPAGRFDGVIGGPPCQAFSSLRHLVEANGFKVAEDMIPDFVRVIEESCPEWFLMENVPAAPQPAPTGYSVQDMMLNNRWLGEEQNRLRRFSFGWWWAHESPRLHVSGTALESPIWEPCVTGSADGQPVALGGSGKPKGNQRRDPGGEIKKRSLHESVRLQGLPSGFDIPAFTRKSLRKAIGNGVPIPMGRAVARAVREAIEGVKARRTKVEAP